MHTYSSAIQRGLCLRSKHYPQVCRGCRFPSILASNVPGPRGSVGRDTVRLLISGHDPDSTGIYILGAFLAEEE